MVCTLGFTLLLATAPSWGQPPLPSQPPDVAWPTEQWPQAPLPAAADQQAIARALSGAFDRLGPAGHPDHRAVLVVHNGQIVLETYAPEFSPQSRFLSWSMAKSITNAMVGLLVGDGRLKLDDPAPVDDWANPQITLRHLLNMTAGLDDDGASGAMLFNPEARENAYRHAQSVAVTGEPGQRWSYSMATSNLLAGMASEMVGSGRQSVTDWLKQRLFAPIGADSFELEFDQTGHFIGGAFAWATARDWARLGYLFLRDGQWDGVRLLPEGWVDFTRTPAAAENNAQFGAHFWVSAPATPDQTLKLDPKLNAFYMNGAQGQLVVLVPDRDLVVVRLGEAHYSSWDDIFAFVNQLALAFPRRSA